MLYFNEFTFYLHLYARSQYCTLKFKKKKKKNIIKENICFNLLKNLVELAELCYSIVKSCTFSGCYIYINLFKK